MLAPPEPTCCAHGTDAPVGAAGDSTKWQSLTRYPLGSTFPVRVAPVIDTAPAGATLTVGGGSVHVNVTAGTAATGAIAAEKPETPVAPAGTPDEPPPPPPPPGYGEFPLLS